jgi:uncharacterized protein (TIGR00369 family)
MGMLGGRVTEADGVAGHCRIDYDVTEQFCHSGDIVQGGFITAMLDAAMSHAVFAHDDSVAALSSLEISTRYLEVTRAGRLYAQGRIVRLSYRTGFLEGSLHDEDGRLLATASTVAKIGRRKGD